MYRISKRVREEKGGNSGEDQEEMIQGRIKVTQDLEKLKSNSFCDISRS